MGSKDDLPRTGSGFGSKVNPLARNKRERRMDSKLYQRDSKGNIIFDLTRKLWRMGKSK